MILPKLVSVENNVAYIGFDFIDDSITEEWCTWQACCKDNNVLYTGVFKLAGHSNNDVLQLIVPENTVNVLFSPLRNFTKFPIAYYRNQQKEGSYIITGNAITGGGSLTIKIPSDSDKSIVFLKKIDIDGDFSYQFNATTTWSSIELVSEKTGTNMKFSDIKIKHKNSGSITRLVGECSKTFHKNIYAEGNKFTFNNNAIPWSYFICWPIPL